MFKRTAILFFLLTALLCVGATNAKAQSSRIYFAGYLGLTKFQDQDFSESSVPIDGQVAFKNGPSFAGALGVRLSKDVRLEAELNYTKTTFDRMDVSGGGSFELGGEVKGYIGLINAYYDFDVPWKLQPFLGAGIGMGWFDGNVGAIAGPAVSTSDETTALAYQLGGGLKYRVSSDLAFTGAYRYLGTTNLGFGSYDIDYGGHEFRIGLEYDLPFD